MKTKPTLTLDDTRRIAAAAEAEALRNNWAVSIAIADDGGHLLWLQRLDGAAPISAQIAPAKAQTAASTGCPSALLPEAVRSAIAAAPEGAMTGLPGGLPIWLGGVLLGGIGIGSGSGAQDVEVAEAALAAIGATPAP